MTPKERVTLKDYFRKQSTDWLITKLEKATNRYFDNEQFLMSILDMPWWKRIFIGRKISKHLQTIMDNYYDARTNTTCKRTDG